MPKKPRRKTKIVRRLKKPEKGDLKTQTALAVRESAETGVAMRSRAPENAQTLWEAAMTSLSPRSREAYAYEWRKFGQWWDAIEPGEEKTMGHTALMQLAAFNEPFIPREVVLQYKDYLDHDKPQRVKKGEEENQRFGVAPATRARAIRALNSMIKKLSFVGYTKWTLDVPAGGSEAVRDTRGPTQEQWIKLRNWVTKKYEHEDLALLHILRTLALRAHEVIKTKISDFNDGRQTLSVIGKGQKFHNLDMPQKVWGILYKQALLQQKAAPAGKEAIYLFGDPLTGMTYDQLYVRVKTWGKDIGLRGGLAPHKLRHSGISRAARIATKKGLGVREVQAISRHENVATVLVYIDELDGGAKSIVDDMLDD